MTPPRVPRILVRWLAGREDRPVIVGDLDEGFALRASAFEVLGVTPAVGRGFTPADTVRGAAPVVVLSDAAWRRRLGADPAAIGRTLVLGGQAHTVIGVLPRTFVFPRQADPELWLPLRPSAAEESQRYRHFLDVIASRRPDVSAHDIPSLAAVIGLLGGVTILACALPAWRAVRLPVTTALRRE